MSTRSGGSFATLLMSGPLAAIPLMAMFGVPQFSTVSASTENKPDDVLRRPEAVTSQIEELSELGEGSATSAPQPVGEFNPFATEDRGTAAAIGHSEPQASADDSTRLSNVGEVSASTVNASQFASASLTKTAPTVSASPQARPTLMTLPTTRPLPIHTSTWENAAQKLDEMGIDDYRLERGLADDTFVFICQFTPGADTRIIRRFEAEAYTPSEAVRDVLEQISHWRTVATTR